MTPQIVDHPGVTLTGFAIRTSLQDQANLRDIPAFWQRYAQSLRAPLLAALGLPHAVEYGVVRGFDPASGTFDYLIGIECQGAPTLPDGAETHVIAPTRYAMFTTPPADSDAAFAEAIVATWQAVYQAWLPTAPWQHAGSESFERYDGRSCPGQAGRQMEIYLPVVPR
ncbi:GyrI-like domain-containing protein [Pseudogulbenkiania sp. MAI-1]|uniref:GyrI-like domain-containing protein n=1 Tax=Pseudogulbenkiania sp. MAI-1 TaxID=990370 RepID=UPI00045E6D30|nr:GyrI-like domain-containing protein [Pseudogulbenkiania sp. MAI-1]